MLVYKLKYFCLNCKKHFTLDLNLPSNDLSEINNIINETNSKEITHNCKGFAHLAKITLVKDKSGYA